MEDNNIEDEAMKVLLNPEAYKKWKESQNKSQSHIELSDEEKAEIEKQMSDPFRTSESKILHWVQDLWEHPEKIKWYRDHILFPSTNEKHFMEGVNDDSGGLKIEIPIFTVDF